MKKFLLISIHPKFADKILSGEKRFEFRKHIPSCEFSHIVIHATAPQKRLLAIAEVEQTLQASPSALWERTKYAAGISRSFFRKYFQGTKTAFAFQIGRVFTIPASIAEQIVYVPPQSYSYFQNSEYIKKLREIINYHNVPSDIIFIGGVHGVGKTYFRNKFLLSAGWYGVSASEIIKQKAGEVNINKRTAAIEDNQKLLQEGLSSIKQRFYRIALDGHFSLINKTGQVTLVSEDTFTGIEPSAIIVLTAPVEIIYDRLRARDDQKYTISFTCFLRAHSKEKTKK